MHNTRPRHERPNCGPSAFGHSRHWVASLPNTPSACSLCVPRGSLMGRSLPDHDYPHFGARYRSLPSRYPRLRTADTARGLLLSGWPGVAQVGLKSVDSHPLGNTVLFPRVILLSLVSGFAWREARFGRQQSADWWATLRFCLLSPRQPTQPRCFARVPLWQRKLLRTHFLLGLPLPTIPAIFLLGVRD